MQCLSSPATHAPPSPHPHLQRRSKLTEIQTAEMIKTAAQVGGGRSGVWVVVAQCGLHESPASRGHVVT